MEEEQNKILTLWYKLPSPIRFIFVGGVNAAVSYVIFAICLYLLGKSYYQLCVILQWVLSSFPSYLNQKFFVFKTKGNYVKEYLKCCSTWVVGYFLNALFLQAFFEFGWIKNVYLAQFISIGLVSAVTYVLFKFFAFKKKK